MIGGAPVGLFGSIPDRDYLGFWQGGKLNPVAVVRFLRFSKADVARIALVSPASVRFDRKIPAPVLERLAQIAIVCGHVAQHFDGNAPRTAAWFMTGNAHLGDLSPRDMILRGRYEALRRFVMQALAHDAAGQLTPSGAVADTEPGAEPGDLPPLILAHQAAISALCLRYGVRQLALFGAILRKDFDAVDSGDIDLVVEFGPPGQASAARQYGDFKRGLGQLLGRAVDLLELSAMQDCRLKRIIQRTQMRIYATAA
jgi:predicted nucleotidyltransferase